MRFWRPLNSEQRSLAAKPFMLFQLYLRSTWRQLVSAPLIAIVTVLIFFGAGSDRSISQFFQSNRYVKQMLADSGTILVHRYLISFAVLFLLSLALPGIIDFTVRLIRSWLCGIWRAAPAVLLFLTLGFCTFWQDKPRTSTAIAAFLLLADFGLFYKGKIRKLGRLSPKEILSPRNTKPKLLLRKRFEADAISEWSQDRLDRSSLVDSLKVQLLIGEVSVIALRGKFGEGKSSVLNLLQEDLRPQAIVVSFSSWLPGSEATLTKELFHDIAKECRKRYYIPGLRKALTRYGAIFSADIPYLRGIREIFEPPTQRQELEEMKQQLEEFPQRIVVLLDEIDRMRRKELLTLMKVIRGTGAVPNLSFVCAFDREQVEKAVCRKYDAESHEYFEKFFPHAVDLPAASVSALKKEFMTALAKSQEDEGGGL